MIAVFMGGWLMINTLYWAMSGEFINLAGGKAGPWEMLVIAIGIHPAWIGPVFTLMGGLWVWVAVAAFKGTRGLGKPTVIASLASFWYAVPGTVTSVFAIAFLILDKKERKIQKAKLASKLQKQDTSTFSPDSTNMSS